MPATFETRRRPWWTCELIMINHIIDTTRRTSVNQSCTDAAAAGHSDLSNSPRTGPTVTPGSGSLARRSDSDEPTQSGTDNLRRVSLTATDSHWKTSSVFAGVRTKRSDRAILRDKAPPRDEKPRKQFIRAP